ncbi:MAG TPA: hypothetical protein VFD65_03135 [Chitinophagales bacterium]|nr:hypothetical protein [Chitinophagales bacterium]
MELKITANNLRKIESILKSNEYVVRYERGHFNSGYCILQEKKVIVVNKFYDIEARMNCLIDILQEIKIDASMIDDPQLEKLYASLTTKRLF